MSCYLLPGNLPLAHLAPGWAYSFVEDSYGSCLHQSLEVAISFQSFAKTKQIKVVELLPWGSKSYCYCLSSYELEESLLGSLLDAPL